MNSFLLKKSSVALIAVAVLAGCVSNNGLNTPVGTAIGSTEPFNGIGGMNRNTTIGAGTGAALGGVIGAAVSKNGKKNEGALIGAALGGVLGGVIGNNYGQRIDQQVSQIGSILNGTGANVTKMADGSLKINLAGDVSFNSGSAAIRSTFVPTLTNVAQVINQTPNSRVVIVGHTDNSGYADANQALSLARANSVRDFLVTSGTSSARMTSYGRGSTQPIADNATEAGRAQNRRVEVFVFPEAQ